LAKVDFVIDRYNFDSYFAQRVIFSVLLAFGLLVEGRRMNERLN
jgi:hypothetical protein